MKKPKTLTALKTLPKSSTGIHGLDEITGGGLPTRAAHARLRRRGLRQDVVGDGISGARRDRVR